MPIGPPIRSSHCRNGVIKSTALESDVTPLHQRSIVVVGCGEEEAEEVCGPACGNNTGLETRHSAGENSGGLKAEGKRFLSQSAGS